MKTTKFENLWQLAKRANDSTNQGFKQSREEYSRLTVPEQREFDSFYIKNYLGERQMIITSAIPKIGGHPFLESLRPTKEQVIARLTSEAKLHLNIAFKGTGY